MKQARIVGSLVMMLCNLLFTAHLKAQQVANARQLLSVKERSIITISALAAKGNLAKLKTGLNEGLAAGLTVNEIKETFIHLYAYCGFPRSIRGLQAFMEVLDERKAKSINDAPGADASPINEEDSKYERGKKILADLTGTSQIGPPTGYSAFAPVIDTFLKEHLFADIFERDVLTYSERELVTISVLGSIGGAEPMLRSHLSICLNLGLSPGQLEEFVSIMRSIVGKKEAKAVQAVLDEVLKSRQ